MGITWRIAMPLLSTLAALVIIVHSAEEDLSREHRYDLRPRVLDTRPTDNEQPWRVVRADPAVQQVAPPENWNDEIQDEPPVRRRVGRKRKRRPPSTPLDETTPEVDEEHQPEDTETEAPVKRRKRPRPSRKQTEPTEETRPIIRKRGQRRRRPSLETWPELSEFSTYTRNKKLLEADREIITQIDIDDDDEEGSRYSHRGYDDDDDEIKGIRLSNRRPLPPSRFVLADENRKHHERPPKEDKSLSEFSMEVMGHVQSNDDADEYDFRDLKDKMKDKSPDVFYTVDKAKESDPIDPQTLKDILKKSNGSSLSEILQQHNLTLADLLNGNANALSVLKSQRLQNYDKSISTEDRPGNIAKMLNDDIKEEITSYAPHDNEDYLLEHKTFSIDTNNKNEINLTAYSNSLMLDETTVPKVQNLSEVTVDLPVKQDIVNNETLTATEEMPIEIKTSTAAPKIQHRNSGMLARRPLPTTVRRKLRMRPVVNNTYKSQINRDLMALSARRYVQHNRRNITKVKAKEWKAMIPLMINLNITDELKNKQNRTTTTISNLEDTTTATAADHVEDSTETMTADEPTTNNNLTQDEVVDVHNDTTTIAVEILATELDIHVTEKPVANLTVINSSGLRRQSYNNRLKKKRIKQKTSTTEAPPDDIMKNLLEMGDLVSSSEFIARTQKPKLISTDDLMETGTELEDFLTTPAATKGSMRSTRLPYTRKSAKSNAVTKSPLLSSTEETAKIEIEEILNDTRTSAKLSKILKERNMTLSELFEHRERGSSHVHLADIFHNASREPNPPEPFLSKSFIEPISKETYPLRALLDANLHDPSVKPTTIDPILTNHVNIPVIMDFGNNVNENAENMGIMSLFPNFTKNTVPTTEENSTIQRDSKGIPYKSTVTAVNATDDDDDTTRESRMLDDEEDMISWNEIFTMIRKNQKNETEDFEKDTNEILPSGIHKKITLEEDIDGDGVIVLEDLQNMKGLGSDTSSASEEKIEFNTLERAEILEPGILNKSPDNTKSVTVATASIVGLAMILFLLTYAALKWRHQRSISHKKALCDERIPSPVFENRKGTKNSSSRSISPMLPTTNIYTMNTLESQNGKDSPEYMWDTLRKPFQ